MKFPKIKHARLCRFLMYVPAILCFVVGFGALFCAEALELGAWAMAIFISSMVLLLIYIFKNMAFLMGMDVILATISGVQRARKRYYSKCNGDSAPVAYKRIARRAAFFGKRVDDVVKKPAPRLVKFKSSRSQTVFYSKIEKMLLVFEAEHLNIDTYRAILDASEAISRTTSAQKPKKAGKVSYAVVCVILANSVFDGIEELINKQGAVFKDKVILPCVADLGSGVYYFDGVREPFSGMAYPTKNRAINMIKKYVFGGKIPLRGNHEELPAPKAYENDLEKSFFEYKKEMKREFNGGLDDSAKRMVEKMDDNEVLMDEDIVYCKLGGRVAAVIVDFDGDSNEASALLSDCWDYPKKSKISKADKALLRTRVATFLKEKGYFPTVEEI